MTGREERRNEQRAFLRLGDPRSHWPARRPEAEGSGLRQQGRTVGRTPGREPWGGALLWGWRGGRCGRGSDR